METTTDRRRVSSRQSRSLFAWGGWRQGALGLLAVVAVGAVQTVARSPQQEITVRFIDPGSGKPIQNYPVEIFQWKANATGGGLAKDVASSQNSRTDRNGEVVVRLAEPVPGSITIDCFDLVKQATGSIDVQDVLKSGVVLRVDVKTWRWTQEMTGKPVEIVIFDRKRTLWERIREEVP